MPRKRPYWAQDLCNLLNDPLEYLRKGYGSNIDTISPDKQKRFKRAVLHLNITLRKIIIPIEEFYQIRREICEKHGAKHWQHIVSSWNDREMTCYLSEQSTRSIEEFRTLLTKTDNAYAKRQAFREAISQLDKIQLGYVSTHFGLSDFGELREHFSVHFGKGVREKYLAIASQVIQAIEMFKRNLILHQDKFPVGSCCYCGKFYIKDRKTQKYCIETHRKRHHLEK